MQLYIKSKNSNYVFAGILKIKNLVFFIFSTQAYSICGFHSCALIPCKFLIIKPYSTTTKHEYSHELCSKSLVIT